MYTKLDHNEVRNVLQKKKLVRLFYHRITSVSKCKIVPNGMINTVCGKLLRIVLLYFKKSLNTNDKA